MGTNKQMRKRKLKRRHTLKARWGRRRREKKLKDVIFRRFLVRKKRNLLREASAYNDAARDEIRQQPHLKLQN